MYRYAHADFWTWLPWNDKRIAHLRAVTVSQGSPADTGRHARLERPVPSHLRWIPPGKNLARTEDVPVQSVGNKRFPHGVFRNDVLSKFSKVGRYHVMNVDKRCKYMTYRLLRS